jgi:hypothetical protein
MGHLDRLIRDRRPFTDAEAFAADLPGMAEALCYSLYATASGVENLYIKPENILLTRGEIRPDFLIPAVSRALTHSGMPDRLGNVRWLAPRATRLEQVRKRAVRSSQRHLFSARATLYAVNT